MIHIPVRYQSPSSNVLVQQSELGFFVNFLIDKYRVHSLVQSVRRKRNRQSGR